MERKQAHLEAQWHKTFHCWVVDKYHKRILFQQRSNNKDAFPNYLDISAAGHILADEKVEDGVREVIEELGIDISLNQLIPMGCRVEVNDLANDRNREFQYIHMLLLDGAHEFSPQVEEVSALAWISIEDALRLFSKKIASCVAKGIVLCEHDKKWIEQTRIVSLQDFVPHFENYYLSIAIMADRAVKGELPLSIL